MNVIIIQNVNDRKNIFQLTFTGTTLNIYCTINGLCVCVFVSVVGNTKMRFCLGFYQNTLVCSNIFSPGLTIYGCVCVYVSLVKFLTLLDWGKQDSHINTAGSLVSWQCRCCRRFVGSFLRLCVFLNTRLHIPTPFLMLRLVKERCSSSQYVLVWLSAFPLGCHGWRKSY